MMSEKVDSSWQTLFKSEETAESVKALRRDVQSYQAPLSFNKETSLELVKIVEGSSIKVVPTSQNELWNEMSSMSLGSLQGYVRGQTELLDDAQAQLQVQRKVGWRRVTTKFQKFAKTFDQFLTAYSGIVEIVKQADGHYGGLASATLSLLYAVRPQISQKLFLLTHLEIAGREDEKER